MIKLENVSYDYHGSKGEQLAGVAGVNVVFPVGKISAIVGASGSGKTTLLKQMVGLLLPQQGKITIFDQEITATTKEKSLYHFRQKVNLLFQFSDEQLFEETAFKDIAFALENYGYPEIKSRVHQAIELAGLTPDLLSRSFLEMSGGQRKKLALACLLALDLEVILLDEPSSSMDPQSCHFLMETLSRLVREFGKTVIFITHDLQLAYDYSDFLVYLEKGKVRSATSTMDFFDRHQSYEGLLVPPFVWFKHQLSQKMHQNLRSRNLEELVQEYREKK